MKRLLKVLFVVAILAAIAKLVIMKQEWAGLTEAQVRDKLDAGLARKVEDADKRKEIADKVVATMRDKGVIREDDAPLAVEAADVVEDAAESVTEAVADAAEAVQESIPEIKEAG